MTLSYFFFFFSLSYFNEKNSPAGLSARLDGNFFLPPSTWFLLVTDATLTKGQTSSHWGGKKKKDQTAPSIFPGDGIPFRRAGKTKNGGESGMRWDGYAMLRKMGKCPNWAYRPKCGSAKPYAVIFLRSIGDGERFPRIRGTV